MARVIRYAIERKRSAEALRLSEQRLRLALDSAKLGTFDFRPLTGELSWDEANKQIWGLVADEDVDYAEAMKRLHPEDSPRVKQEVLESLNPDGSGYFESEYRIIWPDGSVHWTIGRGRVHFAEAGGRRRAVRMVGVQIDITERKLAEEASKVREAELAHLSRVSTMGQMASGLAHELNQPLAAILNYASVCLEQAQPGAPVTPMMNMALSEVMNETRRAGAIISRLRSFVRRQRPKTTSLHVNQLVKEAIGIMDFELRHQGIRPQLKLAEGLSMVPADAVQIEQVLVNLIFNALEAMDESTEPPKQLMIQTELCDDGRSVAVSVIDSGPGVLPENMPRLFNPFFTTKTKGMGMGLNISRSIIESHGGRLSAEANPEGGMRFWFTLPIAEEAAA
jgi:two-component system sensor histidine kinase DctS